MMDFVYLFKNDAENDSEELRYSLRSLRNITHGKVVVIGEKPAWLKDVLFIPVKQVGTKQENVNANMMTAIADNRISDEFVLMNDDFFFTKSMESIEPLHFGQMQEVIDSYLQRYKEVTPYIENMMKSAKLLESEGYQDPLSYELHVPMIMKRSKLREIYKNRTGRLYQIRSYYGNYVGVGGRKVADVKIFIDSRHNDQRFNQEPEKYLASQDFLSATGGAFKTGMVGNFIRHSFPDESPYEA